MAYARAARVGVRTTRGRPARTASPRPLARSFRRARVAILAAPLLIRLVLCALVVVAVWAAVNWAYHVMRKPTELFFPVSGALGKTPSETWRQYGSLFRAHSTIIITPELLAALAQVEARGNPVARTYWRWRLTWHPFELYQPASSAVGMFQMTDATFREAKRYCVRDHVVSESCWFNSLYTRVLPNHAIELAAAQLDRGVSTTIEQQRISRATLQQKQDLAAIIHLCGAGPGEGYARRGFRLTAGQKCGDHDVKSYLIQVNAMKRQFLTLAAAP
jgi:Transglycosylase SLT domain